MKIEFNKDEIETLLSNTNLETDFISDTMRKVIPDEEEKTYWELRKEKNKALYNKLMEAWKQV